MVDANAAIQAEKQMVFLEETSPIEHPCGKFKFLVYWGPNSGRHFAVICQKPDGFYQYHISSEANVGEMKLLGLYGKLRELNQLQEENYNHSAEEEEVGEI